MKNQLIAGKRKPAIDGDGDLPSGIILNNNMCDDNIVGFVSNMSLHSQSGRTIRIVYVCFCK